MINLGRIAQKIETISAVTDTYDYIYDMSGRLEEVQKNTVTVATYGYDDNGNRTSFTDEFGVTVSGIYDAQDRLASYGPTTTYTYTANGEIQSKNVSGDIIDISIRLTWESPFSYSSGYDHD